MTKKLKFKHEFVKEVLEGRKVTTWRLFDDKDLKINDELELIDAETGENFGKAVITSMEEKAIKELTEEQLKNHGYAGQEDMLESHKKYYGDKISPDTPVKMIKFKLK